jgi:NADH-quinone oxidoreductase subunit A
MLFEYLKILIFIIVSLLIVLFLVFLPKIFNSHNVFLKNTSRPVECGSHSLSGGKNKVEFIFYKVLIVFIVFEVEILIIIPWLINFNLASLVSIVSFLLFLLIINLSYFYEYCKALFRFK